MPGPSNGAAIQDASAVTITASSDITITGNLTGARVNNQAYTTSYLRTRNIYFARRSSQNGFGPPWFPATTVNPGGMVGGRLVPAFQRIQWLNETAYQQTTIISAGDQYGRRR